MKTKTDMSVESATQYRLYVKQTSKTPSSPAVLTRKLKSSLILKCGWGASHLKVDRRTLLASIRALVAVIATGRSLG